MDKRTLYRLVTNSTALEGSTLTPAQNRRLLEEGISSEGKTIAEQLMNIDLRDAYEAAVLDAAKHELWSSYRIRQLAAKALRSFRFDSSKVSSDAALQRICSLANEARMHSHSLGNSGLYNAARNICSEVEEARLWPSGNGIMGRLLQNMLEMEFNLEPTFAPDVPDNQVRNTVQAASPAPEAIEAAPKPRNADRILQILAAKPRFTTNELAEVLGISTKGVEKHLARLKKSGRLLRVGPDKGGRWIVPGIHNC